MTPILFLFVKSAVKYLLFELYFVWSIHHILFKLFSMIIFEEKQNLLIYYTYKM